jgi:hypothetical protein
MLINNIETIAMSMKIQTSPETTYSHNKNVRQKRTPKIITPHNNAE